MYLEGSSQKRTFYEQEEYLIKLQMYFKKTKNKIKQEQQQKKQPTQVSGKVP